MKIANFNIIKLTLFLCVGILIAYFFKISLNTSLYLSFSCFVLLALTLVLSKNKFKRNIWFGVFAFLLTVSIGILTTNFNDEKLFKNHYTNYKSLDQDRSNLIAFQVYEVLKAGNYHDKYIIKILRINNKNVSGKALLNITKDSTFAKLQVDDVLVTVNTFQEVSKALNLNQFNYKAYLQKRYIYQQVYTKYNALFLVSNTKNTFLGYASLLRKTINSKLEKYNFKPDELAIINALILGQRQNINKAIYTNYVQAGAIHILAVSGLHVGILLLFLNTLFKPLVRLKNGRVIKMVVIILLLWCYTIIAGASASIIRAATMFSVVAIGMHLQRPSNIYNTLAVSIFIILLFKPMFLFDVGFQLSYLAVFAIVSIQPLLYKLWRPKNWLIHKFWQIFTVTIAVQFGVLPISLFYFHQFPGLFWLSNLVIIPLIGFILAYGILVIVFALLDVLPVFFANVFGDVIGFMNSFFEWIASKDQFVFQDLSFNLLTMLATYLIIVALLRVYVKKNVPAILFLCFSVICFQVVTIYTKYQNSNNSLVVFHKSRNTIVALKHSNSLKVFHNLDSLKSYKSIATFAVANNIKTIQEDSLTSLFFYKNKKILVIDSLGVYPIKSIKPDIVLLSNSPRVNLDRMLNTLKPQMVIADGSNYKSYISRWENTCKKQKLPFYPTGKKGAFVLFE
ncbi:MAG: ComEC/Rec2 family competence protein [Oceanihabitans sp.]